MTPRLLPKPSSVRRLLQAGKALLTIGWVGFGLFLLLAGLVNIHLSSVLAGAGLLGAALVFRRWIIAAWR
jgi:small-conductance mechanosensitive channel